jgi:hypothetical protein
MPRFFLNIRDDDDLFEDLAGSDFGSLASAKREALDRARMIAEMGCFDEPTQVVELCDAARRKIASVRVADQLGF